MIRAPATLLGFKTLTEFICVKNIINKIQSSQQTAIGTTDIIWMGFNPLIIDKTDSPQKPKRGKIVVSEVKKESVGCECID